MNLAEFKYRHILEKDGGPVSSIDYFKHESYEGHHFFATLKPNLILENQNLKIYKQGGGQGSSNNKSLAYYKSISEALEYWAFYEIKNNFSDQQKTSLGFTLDPSSNGMACFPGFFRNSPRMYALYEAIERWSLIAWWDGFLSMRELTPLTYEIITPWNNIRTIILKSSSLISQKPIYGFATDKNLNDAIERAKVELDRNSRVIDTFYASPTLNLESTMEKRLVYFSTPIGESNFNEQIKRSQKVKKNLSKPDLVIDGPILGPWEKYAYLWRCLFIPTSYSFLDSSNDDYFFF